jgi:hypothetical protein
VVERCRYLGVTSPHLPELPDLGSAGFGTCEFDRGCRGINGPVPPPLWMSVLMRQIVSHLQAKVNFKGQMVRAIAKWERYLSYRISCVNRTTSPFSLAGRRARDEGVYITYFKLFLMLLTELNLTNESRSMITSDRPTHLTSPRQGEGFFPHLRREKSQG